MFDEIKFIHTLQLTGGKVFLAYEQLKLLLEIAKEKNVSIKQCSLLTNGTVYDERIYSLLDLKILKNIFFIDVVQVLKMLKVF